MSVFNTNDPIAQVLALRILEALAPLLTDSQDVQHKVLLALESKHKKVIDTAVAVLPKLLVSSASLARHLFSKDFQPHVLGMLVNARYDDIDTINHACAAVYRVFQGAERLYVLTTMALKSQLMRPYVITVLQNSLESNAAELLDVLNQPQTKATRDELHRELGCTQWDVYNEVKAAMLQGEFSRALELQNLIDRNGISDKAFDWLDVLESLCKAEVSPEPTDLYLLVLKLHSLGQGVAVIFHSKLVSARLTFLERNG